MVGDIAVLSTLEQAAEVVLSPHKVNAEKRKAAESFLLEFRKSKSPFNTCKSIFEATKNEFVIFQAAQTIKESTLREWSILELETPAHIWQYLAHYVTVNPTLSGYVIAEILQAVSVIIKRGTFDGKSGSTEPFFEIVSKLISSGEIHLQSLACQMLLSLCTEFYTSWRTASLGITWDFHVRAKRAFETETLKRVFELTVEVLHHLLSSSIGGDLKDRNQVILCNRLLCVAETVLNWHFGSRVLPRRLTYSMEFSATVALRPPSAWKDIFLDQEVLSFFFTLHTKIRHNSELAHHSLQCLIQIGSLSGEVFSDGITSRDAFLAFYTRKFLELFQNGPSSYETLNCCLLLNKVLTYHPLPAIMRLPDDVLKNFVEFITHLSCHLCHKAVDEDLRGNDETQYHEALTRLLDGLTVLLRAEVRMISSPITFSTACSQIFSAYFTSLMGPPLGSRPQVGENREEIAELEEDDREHYADILGDIGIIGRNTLNHVLPIISSVIGDRLSLFSKFIGDLTLIDYNSLYAWQEDMHWLLLVIGYTLTGEDCDSTCFMQPEVLSYFSQFKDISSIEEVRKFIGSCIKTPELVAVADTVEPLFKILGSVFLWGSMEHKILLHEGGKNLLSPQLTSTTMWCIRRIVSSFSTLAEPESETKSLLEEDPDWSGAKRVFMCGTELSKTLTEFLLRKSFGNLRLWSGEEGVAKDAVSIIVSLSELQHRADEVASSSILVEEVSAMKLNQLIPVARKGVLRALVLIGAATNNEEMRKQMYITVLEPLGKQFAGLVSGTSIALNAESDLLDVLDCYGGIAEATQVHSAKFMFEYFSPVLNACVQLMSRCKERQNIVDGVLGFFVEVTKKTAMYLDDKEDSEKLYQYLLDLLKCYAENQTGKYLSKELEEDKASDLSLVMDVLTNIMSKDILILAATEESNAICSATVALLGLEILMPIMNSEILKFPNLCQKYYRMILFVTEMYPENVMQMSPKLIENLIHSVRLGLSNEFGNETMKLSMELLNVIATYACQNDTVSELSRQIKGVLGTNFIKVVFQACLSTSSEVDAFSEASMTLYSLICCEKTVYDRMVSELIASHESIEVQKKLTIAFSQLLSLEAQAVPLRREKRAFKDRFEAFLNEIQGLLCLN